MASNLPRRDGYRQGLSGIGPSLPTPKPIVKLERVKSALLWVRDAGSPLRGLSRFLPPEPEVIDNQKNPQEGDEQE